MSSTDWLRRWSALVDAAASADLRGSEKDTLLCIARQSLGYRREDTRHYLSEAVLARKTGRASSWLRTPHLPLRVSQRQRHGVPWKNSQNARAPSISWFWMPTTSSHRAVTGTSMLGGTCPAPTKLSMDSASPEAHV